ncbi:hypothetical protein SNEBB_005826 [Seison nebaliae]|nr:hypothetical protein SNEBB_005826 [Seison nebaliae]
MEIADTKIENLQQLFEKDDYTIDDYPMVGLKGKSVGEQLSILSDAHITVDMLLKGQITSKHQYLLEQVTNIDDLETSLHSIKLQLTELRNPLIQKKNLLKKHVEHIERNCKKLKNLQNMTFVLHQLKQMSQIGLTLKERHMRKDDDIVTTSYLLYDLKQVMNCKEIKQINLFVECEELSEQVHCYLKEQFKNLFNQSIASLSRSKMTTAFMIGSNIGKLSNTIEIEYESMEKDLKSLIKHSFSFQSTTKDKYGTNDTRIIWSNLLDLSNEFDFLISKVKLLDEILMDGRNIRNGESFGKICLEDECVNLRRMERKEDVFLRMTSTFVGTLILTFHDVLVKRKNVFINKILIEDYPRLLTLMNQFITNLIIKHSISNDIEKLFELIFKNFEDEYKELSRKKLTEPIKMMFCTASNFQNKNNLRIIPTKSDIQNIIQIIVNEIGGSMVNVSVQSMVVTNVIEAIDIYYKEGKKLLENERETINIHQSPSDVQRLISEVVNNTIYFHKKLTYVMNDFGEMTETNHLRLVEKMEDLKKLGKSQINWIFNEGKKQFDNFISYLKNGKDSYETMDIPSKINDEKEEIIKNMNDDSLSEYMVEIRNLIVRLRSTYLSLYSSNDLVMELTVPFVRYIIIQWTFHVAMYRPITLPLKFQLYKDGEMLKQCIANLVHERLVNLGMLAPHVDDMSIVLQSFIDNYSIGDLLDNLSELTVVFYPIFEKEYTSNFQIHLTQKKQLELFMNYYEKMKNNNNHYRKKKLRVIPKHLFALHLFSYLPSTFKSPHTTMKWSIGEYIDRMIKTHSQFTKLNSEESLEVIEKTISSHETYLKAMDCSTDIPQFFQFLTHLINQ